MKEVVKIKNPHTIDLGRAIIKIVLAIFIFRISDHGLVGFFIIGNIVNLFNGLAFLIIVFFVFKSYFDFKKIELIIDSTN